MTAITFTPKPDKNLPWDELEQANLVRESYESTQGAPSLTEGAYNNFRDLFGRLLEQYIEPDQSKSEGENVKHLLSLSRALQLGAEKELTSMQEDYDSLQQELERVQGEQEDLKREVDRWQQADKEKDAHLDEKDAQIQRLEGEKRQAEQEKQQKELESKQWQQEADYLRKKESGSTESEKLSQENANLRHEVDGYHEQLTQMQREKDGLLEHIDQLSRMLEEEQSRNEQVTTDDQALRTSYEQLQHDKDALLKENERLQEYVESMEDDGRKKRSDAEEALEHYKQEKENLQKQVQDLQTRLDQTQHECERLHEKVATMRREPDEAGDAARLEQELQQERDRELELVEYCNELERELEWQDVQPSRQDSKWDEEAKSYYEGLQHVSDESRDEDLYRMKQKLDSTIQKYNSEAEKVEGLIAENKVLREKAGISDEEQVQLGRQQIFESKQYKARLKKAEREKQELDQKRRDLQFQLDRLTSGLRSQLDYFSGERRDKSAQQLSDASDTTEDDASRLRTLMEDQRREIDQLRSENTQLRQDIVARLQEEGMDRAWEDVVQPLLDALGSSPSRPKEVTQEGEMSARAASGLESKLDQQSQELEELKEAMQRTERRMEDATQLATERGKALPEPSYGTAATHDGKEDQQESYTLAPERERQQLLEALRELKRKDMELERARSDVRRFKEQLERSAKQRRVLYAEYVRERNAWREEKKLLDEKIANVESEREAIQREKVALETSDNMSEAVRRVARLEGQAEKRARALERALAAEKSAENDRDEAQRRLSELSEVYYQRLESLQRNKEEAEGRARQLETQLESAVAWESYTSLCEEYRKLSRQYAETLGQQSNEEVTKAEVQHLRDQLHASNDRAAEAEAEAQSLRERCRKLEEALKGDGQSEENDVDELRAKKTSLEAELASSKRQLERAQQNKAEAEKQKDELEKELEQSEAKVSERVGETARAQAGERHALERLERCIPRAEHEREVDATRKEVEIMRNELEEARRVAADHHRIEQELHMAKAESKGAKAEADGLRRVLRGDKGTGLDNERQRLHEQLARSRRREALLAGRLQVAEMEADRLYTEASRLHEVLANRTQALLATKADKRSFLNSHRALQRQLEAQAAMGAAFGQGQLEVMGRAISRANQANASLREEVNKAQARNRQLQEELAEREAKDTEVSRREKVFGITSDNEAWQESHRLVEEVTSAELRAKKAERRARVAENRAEFAESQATELERSLEQQQESASRERHSLMTKLSHLSKRLSELEGPGKDAVDGDEEEGVAKLPDPPARRQLAGTVAPRFEPFEDEQDAAQAQKMMLEQVNRARQLKAERQEAIEELERTRSRANRAERQLREVEAERDEARARVRAVEEEHEGGAQQGEDMGTHIVGVAQSTIERLRTMVDQKETALNRANEQVTKLKEQLAKQQEEDGKEIDRLNDLLYHRNAEMIGQLKNTNEPKAPNGQRGASKYQRSGERKEGAERHGHSGEDAKQLKARAEQAENDVSEKHAEIQRLNEELENVKAQAAKDQQEHEKADVAKLRASLGQKDKRLAQLREAVKELENRLAEALRQKNDEAMRESAAESAAELRGQVNSLSERLRKANASLGEAKQREQDLEAERDRLWRDVNSRPSQQHFRSLQQENRQLSNRVKELQQQQSPAVGSSDQQQQMSDEQQREMSNQIAAYGNENAKLRRRIETLKGKLNSKESELQETKQELAKRKERDQQQQSQQSRQVSSRPASGKASAPNSSVKALQEENERLHDEVERLKRESDDGKVQRLEQEIERLRRERAGEVTHDDTARELQELQDANFDRENTILDLRFDCEQQRAKAERLQNRLAQLFGQSKEESHAPGVKGKKAPAWSSEANRQQELEEVIHGLRRVVERLRGENSSLRQKVSSQQKNAQAAKQAKDAKERNAELEKEIERLRDEAERTEKERKKERRHIEDRHEEERRRLEERIRNLEGQLEGKQAEGSDDGGVEELKRKAEKADSLERENEDLRRELEALDPSFFEEVMQLRQSYQEQQDIIQDYESRLQEFASQMGTHFRPRSRRRE